MVTLLKIVRGSESITLTGGVVGSAVVGCAYTPQTPRDQVTPVVEEATVVIEGASADVLTATQTIERLLEMARANVSANERVYVQVQRLGDTLTWRSQISDGRLVWSTDTVKRFLHSTRTAVSVVVAWERLPYWEATTETAVAQKHIYNGKGSGTDPDGVVVGTTGADAYNAISFTPSGVLPTPAKVTVTNNKGSNSALLRAHFANDVFGGLEGGEHLLEPGSGSETFSFGANGTHLVPIFNFLTLSADQVAAIVAAGGVRLLAVLSSLSSDFTIKAWLMQVNVGSNSFDPWLSAAVAFESARTLYDFGFAPAPPAVRTFDNWRLGFSVVAEDAGSFTLDFVMLCAGNATLSVGLDGGNSMTWPDATAVEWVGEERYGTFQGWHGSLVGAGEVLLRPGRANRLMTVIEGSSGGVDSTLPLLVDVSYRQRRATV